MLCQNCGKEIDVKFGVGRRDTCPGCGWDIRVCRNCKFYDPTFANGCREPQAERVLDKDRSNFCDYFAAENNPDTQPRSRKDDAREKLDALFKNR